MHSLGPVMLRGIEQYSVFAKPKNKLLFPLPSQCCAGDTQIELLFQDKGLFQTHLAMEKLSQIQLAQFKRAAVYISSHSVK